MGQAPSNNHSNQSSSLESQHVSSSIPPRAQTLIDPNTSAPALEEAIVSPNISSANKASTTSTSDETVPATDNRPATSSSHASAGDRPTSEHACVPAHTPAPDEDDSAATASNNLRPEHAPAANGAATDALCSTLPAATSTVLRPSSAADLADSASNQLRGHLRFLHDQLMQQAGADYDIATATTLSYSQFLSYICRLNEICRRYPDADGRVLVFAVKKGSDSSFLWKATVRIACVKYNPATRRAESSRMLTIRQFLQVFRRISYECSDVGSPATTARGCSAARQPSPASVAFSEGPEEANEGQDRSGEDSSSSGDSAAAAAAAAAELEECVICLERRPDVILPCAHAYCLPCIQQWWEYCAEGITAPWFCSSLFPSHTLEGERTCPVCREAVADTDDAWVISEAPDEAQMTREISATLMGLAGAGGSSSSSGGGACRGGGK